MLTIASFVIGAIEEMRNPVMLEICPKFLKAENVESDLKMFSQLSAIQSRLDNIYKQVDSTRILAGSETYTSALTLKKLAEAAEGAGIPGDPAKDFININGASIGNIALYDILGHLIENEKVTMNNTVLNVKGLPAGTYILKITTEEGREGSASIILNGE